MKTITLIQVRQLAVILTLMTVLSGVSYFAGKYQVDSIADVITGLKSELSPSTQTDFNLAGSGTERVSMDLFWQVWDKLENEYLFKDRMDDTKMVYGAIQGMVAAAGDPYTAFYPPQENQTSKENLNGSFFGVGIQLGYKLGDQLAVIAPISGMPAEKAGVVAGDFILKIVDKNKGIEKDTYGMSLIEAVEIIRGEQGSEVTLTLLHEGKNEPYEVTIKREEIVVPSVEVEFGTIVDGKFVTEENAYGDLVAHLKLTRFGELTDQQWDESIAKIMEREKDLKGVILDVRNNPGGYMQGAINLAAEFLPVGKTVVKQEHTLYPVQEFKTERFGRLLDLPMVVLINQGSASASEILAAALKEHGRAKLVGVTSFGKGTIQSAEDFSNGAGIHITIARWLTPEGNWVHDKGLTPDVEVKLDPDHPDVDTQLIGAVQVLEGKSVSISLPATSAPAPTSDASNQPVATPAPEVN